MKDVLYHTVGELVRKYRRDAGMTLSKLSELSGIPKGTISRIENGNVKKPEFQTVGPLAATLGIPFEDVVERYIHMEKRADPLLMILQSVIPNGNMELIEKIALRFLESPSEDSYDLVERLFTLTNTVEDKKVRLALYRMITNHSRDHGIGLFLAKGLLYSYLIERDDFSKLESTYQNGRHVLQYIRFLSDEERLSLHYKLGVHAYNLMKYKDCATLCEYIVINEKTRSKVKANALYAAGLAYYELGNYEKLESYLREYGTYPYPDVKQNKKMTTALIKSRKGNIEEAVEQLWELLPKARANNILLIITRLFEIYLQTNNVQKATELLAFEAVLEKTPLQTPISRSQLAYFYRLKGVLMCTLNQPYNALDSFYKSAVHYSKISQFDEIMKSLNMGAVAEHIGP